MLILVRVVLIVGVLVRVVLVLVALVLGMLVLVFLVPVVVVPGILVLVVLILTGLVLVVLDSFGPHCSGTFVGFRVEDNKLRRLGSTLWGYFFPAHAPPPHPTSYHASRGIMDTHILLGCWVACVASL